MLVIVAWRSLLKISLKGQDFVVLLFKLKYCRRKQENKYKILVARGEPITILTRQKFCQKSPFYPSFYFYCKIDKLFRIRILHRHRDLTAHFETWNSRCPSFNPLDSSIGSSNSKIRPVMRSLRQQNQNSASWGFPSVFVPCSAFEYRFTYPSVIHALNVVSPL